MNVHIMHRTGILSELEENMRFTNCRFYLKLAGLINPRRPNLDDIGEFKLFTPGGDQ